MTRRARAGPTLNEANVHPQRLLMYAPQTGVAEMPTKAGCALAIRWSLGAGSVA